MKKSRKPRKSLRKMWMPEGRNDYLIIALQKLLEAVQLLEEPDIYEHIGDVHYSLGHWDEAVKVWEKAQTLYKNVRSNEVQVENITTKLEKVKRLISLEEMSSKPPVPPPELATPARPPPPALSQAFPERQRENGWTF